MIYIHIYTYTHYYGTANPLRGTRRATELGARALRRTKLE